MSNLLLPKSNFIHIPKCAGTLISTALWRLNLVKDKANELRYPHYGHLFASQMPDNGKPCFAFVRNPVTWWHSFYYWNMREGQGRFMDAERQTTSFNQWVDEYGQFWLGNYSNIVRRYLGRDPAFPTKNRVELVGRAEEPLKDLIYFLKHLGENYDMKVARELITNTYNFKDEHRNIQDYNRDAVSPETRAIILKTEWYVRDFFAYQ